MSNYLENLEKQADILFSRVSGWETNALRRIGRRVKEIGSLSYADLQAINNAAIVNQDVEAIMKELAEITGQNIRDIETAYNDMISTMHEDKKTLYNYRNKPFIPFAENKELQAITRAFAKTTATTFVNLSMTKANRIGFVDDVGTFKPIDKAFKEVIDKAVMSVSTGTGDFNSEMLDVLRQLGGSGVRVDYGNNITRSLDSMVRQNLLWGAKQTAREYEHIIGDELGCDGIEIDWHSNPRPSHEFMQGKQYILGKARTVNGIYFESADKALEALDDYGCLHFETRIICGVSEPRYSPEELKRLDAENKRPIEIDGVTKTGYEWKQTMRSLERAGKQTKLKRETFKSEGNNIAARKQSQRLQAIEEKYQLIADKTGIKAQYEKMAIVKGKSVDNSGKSDIIKEQSKKNITIITDKAIEKVPKVVINGFSDEQNTFIQKQHKELLKYAKQENENKEVAFAFRSDLSDKTVFIGSEDDIEFGYRLMGKGDNLFVMHNHPKNSSFSDLDIQFFISNENVGSFSIVKNNGSVEVITKTNEYSLEKIKTVVGRAYKKIVKNGTHKEMDEAIEYILSNNGGIVEWIK